MADAFAEEINEIADDSRNDWIERKAKNGEVTTVFNGEAVARDRLRIDTRKWIVSKLLPKTYGEKVELEHSGGLSFLERINARNKERLEAMKKTQARVTS